MPHANSRFSRPRAISPSASEGTLPCSAVSSAASSLRRASTRLRMRNMISVRFDSDVARQAGKAALAAATAAVDLLDGGEVDALGLPAGRRVVDRAAAAGRARHARAADPVADRGKRVDAEPAGSATWVIGWHPPGRAGDGWFVPPTVPPRPRGRECDLRTGGVSRESCHAAAWCRGSCGLVRWAGRRRSTIPATDTSRTSAPTATTIAITWSALNGPTAASSLHVVATSARAPAHRATPSRKALPSRRPNPPMESAPVRRSRTPAVASASYSCDGCDGMAGASDRHGPGPA